MNKSLLLAGALAGPLLFSWAGTAAAGYSVQTVTDPTGNNFINLLGINNAGTIAGFDNNNPAQGFTLTLPGSFTSENFAGAASTMVTAINNDGSTAGIYVDAAGNTHGFTDTGGTFQTIDNPHSAVFNQALGINNARETVGYYAPTQAGTTNQIAYSQFGGAFTDINHLLPSNVNSQAVGVNNSGAIVGFYQPTADTSLGFVDKGGVISTIDPLGSTFTQALGINDSGEIVGFFTDANGVQHGYVDNNNVVTAFDPAGSLSTTINGVNGSGQIAGFFTDGNDNVIGFVGTPVPEPAAPMTVALAGLLAVRLRLRNSGSHAM
jgi:probable HAF family extracellular repeat protein